LSALDVLSTRLFPKKLGADRYALTGLAARCDWVVLSDHVSPHTHLHIARNPYAPETIFLSLRAHDKALEYFAETVLPRLTRPFFLMSGSCDITLPRQTDKRWPPLNSAGREYVEQIANHPLLLKWSMENMDCIFHPRVRPLPIGMIYSDAPMIRSSIPVPNVTPLAERPLRVLCGHRVRDGAQWETRKLITKLAKADWSAFTTSIETNLPEPEFLAHMQEHSFILCAEGGGLDPSPKAWQALLHGAIPIIRKTALYEAYRQLPVAFVEAWTPDAISVEKLARWKELYLVNYDIPQRRAEIIRRLSIDYWWDQATKIKRNSG